MQAKDLDLKTLINKKLADRFRTFDLDVFKDKDHRIRYDGKTLWLTFVCRPRNQRADPFDSTI